MCVGLYIVGSLTFWHLPRPVSRRERECVYYRKRGRERECVRRERAYHRAQKRAAEQSRAEQSTQQSSSSRARNSSRARSTQQSRPRSTQQSREQQQQSRAQEQRWHPGSTNAPSPGRPKPKLYGQLFVWMIIHCKIDTKYRVAPK